MPPSAGRSSGHGSSAIVPRPSTAYATRTGVPSAREDVDRARVRLLETEVERDAVAEVGDAIGRGGVVGGDAGLADERGERVVHRLQHALATRRRAARDEPADVQGDDEIHDRVLAGRRESALLDRQPPVSRDLPDLVDVVLVVSAVVLRDAANEALARKPDRREGVAPRVGQRGREPSVLTLREHDLASA